MAEYNREKYYWIKLKQSLLTSKAVDFLMSQKDGANYVVLYQCLCLNTINQNGELADRIGEIIVPFDENKIQRETKWFSIDTIRVAMVLYKQLGLIYEQSNGILKIADFEDLVGSQTISAYKKQLQLKSRVENNVEQRVEQRVEKIPPDIDNKILDIDIDIEKESREKEKVANAPSPLKRFIKPSIEEIKAYCTERQNKVDAQRFYDFYESKGWKVGNQPMKDWQACIRTWEKRDGYQSNTGGGNGFPQHANSFPRNELTEFYSEKELENFDDIEV